MNTKRVLQVVATLSFFVQTLKIQYFLLLFLKKWGRMDLQVEESGRKWVKVVDKFITLWKTLTCGVSFHKEGRCL